MNCTICRSCHIIISWVPDLVSNQHWQQTRKTPVLYSASLPGDSSHGLSCASWTRYLNWLICPCSSTCVNCFSTVSRCLLYKSEDTMPSKRSRPMHGGEPGPQRWSWDSFIESNIQIWPLCSGAPTSSWTLPLHDCSVLLGFFWTQVSWKTWIQQFHKPAKEITAADTPNERAYIITFPNLAIRECDATDLNVFGMLVQLFCYQVLNKIMKILFFLFWTQ